MGRTYPFVGKITGFLCVGSQSPPEVSSAVGAPSSGSPGTSQSSADPTGQGDSGPGGSGDTAPTASAASSPDPTGRGPSAQTERARAIPPPAKRRRVARLQRCFGVLGAFERRVLVMRYGLAGHQPQAFEVVARRLAVSTAHVERTESGAVSHLVRAAAAGPGCGAGGTLTLAARVETSDPAPSTDGGARNRAGAPGNDPPHAADPAARVPARVARQAASVVPPLDRIPGSTPGRGGDRRARNRRRDAAAHPAARPRVDREPRLATSVASRGGCAAPRTPASRLVPASLSELQPHHVARGDAAGNAAQVHHRRVGLDDRA